MPSTANPSSLSTASSKLEYLSQFQWTRWICKSNKKISLAKRLVIKLLTPFRSHYSASLMPLHVEMTALVFLFRGVISGEEYNFNLFIQRTKNKSSDYWLADKVSSDVCMYIHTYVLHLCIIYANFQSVSHCPVVQYVIYSLTSLNLTLILDYLNRPCAMSFIINSSWDLTRKSTSYVSQKEDRFGIEIFYNKHSALIYVWHNTTQMIRTTFLSPWLRMENNNMHHPAWGKGWVKTTFTHFQPCPNLIFFALLLKPSTGCNAYILCTYLCHDFTTGTYLYWL